MQYVSFWNSTLISTLPNHELHAPHHPLLSLRLDMGVRSTVSLALPGSVIDNAQTLEMATIVAGQIARASAIFTVDEVVVLDDTGSARAGKLSHGAAFLARILQYLETPQYLRRSMIPMHDDLRHVGLLPPLDTPHHMRAEEWCTFREGVVLRSAKAEGSYINVGLSQEAHVEDVLKPGSRVTLRMGEQPAYKSSVMDESKTLDHQAFVATLTSPAEPGHEGLYWGYYTRIATSLQDMISSCPFKAGYDLVVGTSEHGTTTTASKLSFPHFQHLLLVFGGPRGLEDCFRRDDSVPYTNPRDFFSFYLNTCPEQGSRTIRTEEAILISLSFLGPNLQ